MINSYTYLIRAYETDDYELFKKLVVEETNHEMLFMLFMEIGYRGNNLYSDYLINLINFSIQELKLCAVAELECVQLLYAKYNLAYDEDVRKHIINDIPYFQKLIYSIHDSDKHFVGIDADLKQVRGWLSYINANDIPQDNLSTIAKMPTRFDEDYCQHKISDLIDILEDIKRQRGDLRIIYWDQNSVVKFNNINNLVQPDNNALWMGGFHVNGDIFYEIND